MYIKLKYKKKETFWRDIEDERDMNRLKKELFAIIGNTYLIDCITREFDVYGRDEPNGAISAFLLWMDPDIYDRVCDLFFHKIIIRRLIADDEYRGITIRTSERKYIIKELRKEEMEEEEMEEFFDDE